MAEDKQSKIIAIKAVLEQLRPHLQMDGGDAEFVSFDLKTGVLKIKFQGACVGCPMSTITLENGIGRAVMEKVPAVKKIEAI